MADTIKDESAIFDPGEAPPKATYTAPWPLTLTSYSGVPVRPPVSLAAGEKVDLWWVIDAGEIRYEHSGSGKR